MTASIPRRSALASFLWGAPIGAVGGLIGLGGAEFRLPVLVGALRYEARQAVPLNLSVSLLTVLSASITRTALGGSQQIDQLGDLGRVIGSLIVGGVVGAWTGAAWTGRISDRLLELAILVLLVSIGALLLTEAFLEWEPSALATGVTATVVLGFGFGFLIGIVSSLLGVAGGELIIPTLILAFGVEIKVAGTASLLISIPTMIVGILRHYRNGAFAQRADLTSTVLPMGIGSVLGAIAGGALVAYVSSQALKLTLGVLLIASATRTFRH